MIINRLKAAYLAFKNPAAIYDGLLMQDIGKRVDIKNAISDIAKETFAYGFGTGLKDQLVEKTPNAAEQAIDIWFGKSINDPRDVWDMKTPVYTLEDIGWKDMMSKKQRRK